MTRRYSTARLRTLVIVLALVFLGLVSRFAWVQVVRAEHWRAQARTRSTEIVPERAPRGRILDVQGRVLAADEPRVHVGVSGAAQWLETGDVKALAQSVGKRTQDVEKALRGRKGHVRIAMSVLLDPATRARLERDPSITIEEAPQRAHPYGTTAAAFLGVVRSNGEGVSGLEAVHDTELAGRMGRVRERRDVYGEVRDRTPVDPPVPGADLELTLDLQVQGILERELENARVEARAHSAQGIVMDPWTGDVIALAQVPLAPEPLTDQPDLDPDRVMAAADLFEPGSVFKIFTMATLLRLAVVDTADVYDGGRTHRDQRRVKRTLVGGFEVQDVHPVGRVSLRHAFATSSNIIFAEAALQGLRDTEFFESLRAFGFGERIGSGFPGETRGILPEVARWVPRTQPTIAIGQRVGVNLLQLATAASATISDGDLRAPRFVRRVRHADGRVEEFAPVVRRAGLVPRRVVNTMRALCREAVAAEYGTGEMARIPGLETAGKTGTAQVGTATGYLQGVYTPTFVGFVPAHAPRLLVVIVLHRAPGESTYGGNTAAPCFARVVGEIASSTRYLDAVSFDAEIADAERITAPQLVGRSVDEVQVLAERALWRLSRAELPAEGRVVGQLPPAGTPMRRGTVVQLAFAEVRP